MAEFLAETLERELDSGIKELVNKKKFSLQNSELSWLLGIATDLHLI